MNPSVNLGLIVTAFAILGGVILLICWVVLPFSIHKINKNLETIIQLMRDKKD